eukprot:TRINITY_DN7713_c0_g1_i1.p1 TRINITY_DN7713_c0_g1~~TRINITY_DN7713_c0_g1_i1.p1  ORF type:complete len:481 (+),score=97.79 TRINITY_DN7713_c0_g1_i1:129-1571(+)
MSGGWIFTAEALEKPVREGGTDPKTAQKYRRQICEFMQEVGIKLRLPQLTIATGVVYLHRFFARKDFSDYDKYLIGIACLFLASKVEETPKKLRDVICTFHELKHQAQTPKEKYEPLRMDSSTYDKLRKDVVISERVVLQTISFDLTVEHPYKFLLGYVKKINGTKDLAQVAWNFVNDSLRYTVLCLQYKPQLIASAAIYLASRFLNQPLLKQGDKEWWEIFDAKISDINNISNQILDLYQKKNDEANNNQQPQAQTQPSPSQQNQQQIRPTHASPSPSSSTHPSSSQPSYDTPHETSQQLHGSHHNHHPYHHQQQHNNTPPSHNQSQTQYLPPSLSSIVTSSSSSTTQRSHPPPPPPNSNNGHHHHHHPPPPPPPTDPQSFNNQQQPPPPPPPPTSPPTSRNSPRMSRRRGRDSSRSRSRSGSRSRSPVRHRDRDQYNRDNRERDRDRDRERDRDRDRDRDRERDPRDRNGADRSRQRR